MKIPVKNIYYLLSYAWNKLDEGERIKVSDDEYVDSLELFVRVLINGCKHLFKRGIENNYNEVVEEYRGVKGKIIFKDSLNKNSFRQGRAFCQFDRFEPNILSNQILKATFRLLCRIKSIDKKLKEEIWNYYWKFHSVDDINLTLKHFAMVRINRNNSIYYFLTKICKLIFENSVLNEKEGEYVFKDFMRDDKVMASLFEAFVRNFYRKEQDEFIVRREDILWDAIPLGGTTIDYLPKMQTDITLESANRKIIIDTKYYASALTSRFETEKYNSSNLYQIYSYLRNIETKYDHHLNSECEGILLYPAVGYNLNESYKIGNHNISIKTIDLSKNWKEISNELFKIVGIDFK